MNFKISVYLRNYNSVKREGTCIACGKTVQWAKPRVASHKRSSCTNASEEEKLMFSKESSQSLGESTSLQQPSDPSTSATQPGENLS